MADRLRVALVVQRYGDEVSGGAETLARRIATLISGDVDLTVLTTCALEYTTWENHYPPGATVIDGVAVLRFAVDAPRVPETFEEASRLAYERPDDLELGRAWMHAQGPNASGLLEHLRDHGTSYDAVAFVTYLYAPTADGLPLVADRSVLVPAVHDEPPLRLRLFDEVFAGARILLFSTPEERELARDRFDVEDERARIVGLGVDEPPPRGEATLRLDRPYALYVGRLDLSKGVGDLIDGTARIASGIRTGSTSSSSEARRSDGRRAVAPHARVRPGGRQARGHRWRDRCGPPLAVREPVDRPARGLEPRTADPGERALGGPRGPDAKGGRRPVV